MQIIDPAGQPSLSGAVAYNCSINRELYLYGAVLYIWSFSLLLFSVYMYIFTYTRSLTLIIIFL